jgi:hypothetical protein
MSQSSSTANGPAAGGDHDDDDTFERDLKEMLKDGPTLSDMSSPIQGGGPGSGYGGPPGSGQPPVSASRSMPPSSLAAVTGGNVPRSQSVPPG